MKVTIKDNEALITVTPNQMRDYVTKNGFELVTEISDDEQEYYRKYSEKLHRHITIIVPRAEVYKAPFYVSENLMELEYMTGKSQLQLYCDICKTTLSFTYED